MYILDTHTLLWYLFDSKELSGNLKDFISACDVIAVSIVSLWEIAIKQSLGKLKFESTISKIAQYCYENDILILPIKVSHLDLVKTLPSIHGDPFDRLLICQTMEESAVLITRDTIIPKYSVETMWY